jgi:hypothetical protein
MAAEEDLTQFVREALAQGQSRAQIEAVLGQAGWRPEQVRRALHAFADVPFPVPVPRPRPYLSAREAFLYLVLFTALYISAYNLGALAFHFIERAFPDAAAGAPDSDARRQAIRWAVANLLVSFPLFLALSVSRERALAKDPTRRGSRVRKWLTYLTLFLGAGVLLGDLIALVNGVLSGDLTTRFVLKVAVVAAIAGTAFGYYLGDLRQDEREDES